MSHIRRTCSGKSLGMPSGPGRACGGLGVLAGAGDADFQLAHGRQVLLDLAAVGAAEARREAPGVLQGEVEHAAAVAVAAGDILAGPLAREEALEDGPGVDLLGHRQGFRSPRDVRRVGAAIARVAVAGLGAGVASEFQRGEPRRRAELAGGDLIDRDADLDVGAVGLHRVGAGEERGEPPRMIAGPVAQGLAPVLGQAGQDGDVALERLERFQDVGERLQGPLGGGGPVPHVGAVGDVDEGHPPGAPAVGRQGPSGGPHRLQPGQGDRRPQAAEGRPPRNLPGLAHGVPSVGRSAVACGTGRS